MSRLLRVCLLVATAVFGAGVGVNAGFISYSVRANSAIGKKLLAEATVETTSRRSLEEEDDPLIAGYSLKFLWCHSSPQWDDEGGDGSGITMKYMARFRLCPSDSCRNDDSTGCSEGYGDYVLDLSTFVEAWLQAIQQGGNGGEDDGFNALEYCQCGEFQDNNGDEFFVSPYCPEEGNGIRFGLFSDDACSDFSSTDFYEATGYFLPYADGSSLISNECVSCQGSAEGNDNNEDQGNSVSEFCLSSYEGSAKCETNMEIAYPTENGCEYISGLISEVGGASSSSRMSKGLKVWLIVLGILAVLLGAYVLYLKKKIERSQVNLNSGGLGSMA